MLLYDNLPWVIAATGALVALLIFAKIWKSIVTSKVRSAGGAAGMRMSDVDKMRKQEIISDEEYRRIRAALAQHEVAAARDQERIEKERAILAQAEKDPDAVRLLLSPDPCGGAERRPPARAVQAHQDPAHPMGEGAPKPGDLEVLLQKGAITREEYERLKRFFE